MKVKLNDYNVFLYGGLSQANQSLGDGWILNTLNFNWTKVTTTFETRLWHTAEFNELSSQIYVFGGSSTDIYINQPILPEHTLKITLTPESLKRQCINFICSNVKMYESIIRKNFPQIPVSLQNVISLKSSMKLNEARNATQKIKHQSEYCTVF